MNFRHDILARLFRLAACLLMLAAAAVAHNGKVLDHPVARGSGGTEPTPAVRIAPDGARVANSAALAVAVDGYGGPVPVEVEERKGRVAKVSPVLPNDETPMFFGLLDEAGFWHSWDELPVEEALSLQVDAVASATYSSRAAIANVRAALGELASVPVAPHRPPAETLAALAVLLAAAVLPLFPRTRSRRWRTVILVLDVAVLGVWNDLFLSLDRLVGWATNGLPGTPADAAAALLLLAMAFLYPLFGRASHYCLHACPFGALQELASRLRLPKARLAPGLVRALAAFRRLLWAAVMLSLWCGLEAPWTGWELFGAFAWRAVPVLVTALAVAAVALSAFVPRAYCRFLCPTGTLLKTAEAPD
jgi:uncharacterized protein with FMN-binding domain